jgi:hypothetical protein
MSSEVASSAAPHSRGAAIPFVTVDEKTGEFVVSPEAVAYLNTVQTKVAVVALAGSYRTGKSFLLNTIRGLNGKEEDHDAGFKVGATVNACTKGIWICPGDLENDEDDTTVILMDTEGFESTTGNQSQDTRTFALSVLLSSMFMYNSMNVIDSNAIDKLSLVIDLTNHIRFSGQNEGENNMKEISAILPSFLWLVRDFSLQLKDKAGKKYSATKYLEERLENETGLTEDAQGRNMTREKIRNFFTDRDCVTMTRPAEDEAAIKKLMSVAFDDLRPQFKKAVGRIMTKIKNAKAKSIMGTPLTGPMLAILAANYAKAFNDGQTVVIMSAWSRVLQTQNETAFSGAVNAFKTSLNGEMNIDARSEPFLVKEFQEACKGAKKAAYTEFLATFVYDEHNKSATREAILRVEAACQAEIERVFKKNQEASLKQCTAVLEEMQETVKEQSEATMANIDDGEGADIQRALATYKAALEEGLAKFRLDAKGPAKDAALSKFLEASMLDGVQDWVGLLSEKFKVHTPQQLFFFLLFFFSLSFPSFPSFFLPSLPFAPSFRASLPPSLLPSYRPSFPPLRLSLPSLPSLLFGLVLPCIDVSC